MSERVPPDSTLQGAVLEDVEDSLLGAPVGRGLLEDMLAAGSSNGEWVSWRTSH